MNKFQDELEKRLKENKKLSERQFLPEKFFGVASWVVVNMFYLLILLSFVLAVVTFKFRL